MRNRCELWHLNSVKAYGKFNLLGFVGLFQFDGPTSRSEGYRLQPNAHPQLGKETYPSRLIVSGFGGLRLNI